MTNKATVSAVAKRIHSIKFYCSVPQFEGDRFTGTEVKPTYYSNDNGPLTYTIDAGPSGLLTVNVGPITYVYQLKDIVGRIEVSAQ